MDSTYGLVIETLYQATSQNPELFKPAEQKLFEWQTQAGFYNVLKEIFKNRSIDNNVRLLAVLYCKNGVERFWRKTAPNAMSEEEKSSIRYGLLADFTEPVNQIAVQIAVLISKIARYDCPHDWNELIPTLLNAMKSNDHIVQHRAILSLHQVVKSLASKRLAGDRHMFQELSSSIFSMVYQFWEAQTQLFFMHVGQNYDEATKYLEKGLLGLKILDKLVCLGFKKPHESQDVNSFLNSVFDRCKTCLQIRISLKESLRPPLEKFIIKLSKILLNLLECHPFSFVEFIHHSLELSAYYAFTPEGEKFLFDRFVLQCFSLMKSILTCSEYRPGKRGKGSREDDEGSPPESLRASEIKDSVLTSETVTAICRRIVTHYFLLTQNDLQLWETDPESFAAIEEGGEAWKYAFRPCVELLFVILFREFRNVLCPILLELVQTNYAIVAPDDMKGILTKDAVYCAIGLAADFYFEINFDDWFSSTLQTELTMPGSNYRILRRRVAWLLGKMTGVKLSANLHPLLYQLMIPLLEPTEDMVVRLTAAMTVRTAVDCFEFNLDAFMEFLEPMFRLLFRLLKEAAECDTKMRVLYVMSFIIERVGMAIEPHCQTLVQYLPMLWDESDSHNMLRCAVVATLVHLAKVVGPIAVPRPTWNFILSVISTSTDVEKECFVYLLEDGLELWRAIVENSEISSSQEILRLYSNMPPLLEQSAEYLRCCLNITEAYVILCPDEFMQAFGEVTVKKCMEIMPDLKSEGVILIMKLFETFIKASPTYAVGVLKPYLPMIFEVIYRGEEFPTVMSMYLAILSRILLSSKEAFTEAVNALAEKQGNTMDAVLNRIITVWLEKMPLVSQHEKKKLMGLALSFFFTAQSMFVYDKFCGILLAVTEVLNDITGIDYMGTRTDSLTCVGLGSSPESSEDPFDTEHDRRKKQVCANDPVYRIVLEDYARNQLEELRRMVGQAQFEQFVQTVDCETLSMAKEYFQL